MMYGQMTADSWGYMGTQRIIQETYRTLSECTNQHFANVPRFEYVPCNFGNPTKNTVVKGGEVVYSD